MMPAPAPPAPPLSPADREAVARILACRPVLTGLETAGAALGLAEGALGHAGPPFRSSDEIPPTVMGALIGAVLHEGWAGTRERAERMIRDGEIALHSNHDLGTVSPMAGVVRPSQPVMRVENGAGPGTCWATFAEAGRQALRFGPYGPATRDGLIHVETVIAPQIAAALPRAGLAVWPLVNAGLQAGDDIHQRNVGAMAAFLAALPDLGHEARRWLPGAPQHFLNYAMAAAKLCLDRASGVAGAQVVTALSRNGTDCAIRIAGLGARWFRAPASLPRGGFFAGFAQGDAQPDLGDSAIVESFGLGGCATHCTPEIVRVMQADWAEARAEGPRMRALFAARNPAFDPALAGAEGLGAGLLAGRAAQLPDGLRIHTGIAHRNGRDGWIGIGIARAPSRCFRDALEALAAAAPEAPGGAMPPPTPSPERSSAP